MISGIPQIFENGYHNYRPTEESYCRSNAEVAAYELADAMSHLSQPDRMEVLGYLNDVFCRHCGTDLKTKPYRRCNCNNDE